MTNKSDDYQESCITLGFMRRIFKVDCMESNTIVSVTALTSDAITATIDESKDGRTCTSRTEVSAVVKSLYSS
jgi:hypothetical protein